MTSDTIEQTNPADVIAYLDARFRSKNELCELPPCSATDIQTNDLAACDLYSTPCLRQSEIRHGAAQRRDITVGTFQIPY